MTRHALLAASVVVLASLPLAPLRAESSVVKIESLRCEYLDHPLAIDAARPRFSWVLTSTERNQKQTAYQAQVSTNGDFRAPGWDSGKVASAASTQIEYAGPPLASDHTYYWRVKVWDAHGAASEWSETTSFGMGLLAKSDWKARWITGAGILRNTVELAKPVARARLFVAATGYYEFHINGRKVGTHVLDPAWTDFSKRAVYSTYDVTANLQPGMNTFAAMLGRAWYGKIYDKAPNLIAQLQGEFTDGTPFVYTTDADWRALPSPITFDDIYDGESYDARREGRGWDANWYGDGGVSATLVDLPRVELSAQAMPAIEVVETLIPHKLTEPAPGVFVYDFGQNFSGWARLRVHGAAGTRVRLRFAEVTNSDGTINVENLRSAKATDSYILKGEGVEEYEPRFTYHGFRYVELTGYPGTPDLDTVRGREVHQAVRTIGSFTSSKQLLNEIQHAFVWSIKTNLHGVPTDCDQRDERLGWTGDAHLSAETAMFNYDMAAFYTNFLRDIHDAQGAEGEIPNTVPFINKFGLTRVGDPSWGVVYPLLVRYLYENYGDTRVLSEHYEGIKAWANFLHKHAATGIVDYAYFGDWVPIAGSPKAMAGTFSYILSADIVALAADRLGRKEDAETFRKYATEARAAFHKKYLGHEGYYEPGSQGAQVMALYADVPPRDASNGVYGRLLDDLNYYHNVHLTTGILATKYLFPVLSSRGNADLAYDVMTQPDYPGYGFMMAHGATTLWELWQERTGPDMNSHNHHMFASAGTFLYRTLAGLEADAAGYAKIRIAPHLVHDLNWASASTETPYGLAGSSWKRVDTGYELTATVPVGATATVELPKLKLTSPVVMESGAAVTATSKPAGILSVMDAADHERLVVGSGVYRFVVREGNEQ